MIFRKFCRYLISGALICTCGIAQSQPYPSKPVRIILPFAPGGPIDLLARPTAQMLTETLGQPFIVDYKVGALGIIGSDYVAKSSPDGYTLMIFSTAHTLNPSTQKSLPYDTLKDFAAVSSIAYADFVFVVRSNLPVRNVKELIAYAKQYPNKLNFGSSGVGGVAHLGVESLKVIADIQLTHVPYKGAGQVLQDVVAGTVDMGLMSLPPAAPMIKAGKLRLIGIAGPRRAPAFPDTPTIEEQGFPKYDASSYFGFIAATGTPMIAIDRVNSSMEKILASAEIKQAFSNIALNPWYLKPPQLQSWLQEEVNKWQRVARAINYQPK